MKLSHNIDLYIELFTEIVRMHDEVDYRKHLNAYPGRINGNMGDIAVFLKMELRRQISLLLHSKAVYRFSLTSVLYGVADSVVVVGDKTVSVLG